MVLWSWLYDYYSKYGRWHIMTLTFTRRSTRCDKVEGLFTRCDCDCHLYHTILGSAAFYFIVTIASCETVHWILYIPCDVIENHSRGRTVWTGLSIALIKSYVLACIINHKVIRTLSDELTYCFIKRAHCDFSFICYLRMFKWVMWGANWHQAKVNTRANAKTACRLNILVIFAVLLNVQANWKKKFLVQSDYDEKDSLTFCLVL